MKGYLTVRRFGPWVGIWLVLAAIFGLLADRLFRRPYVQLVSTGVVAEGRITLKEPDNHQNVHYSYIVGSETYHGIGHGGQGGMPTFEKLQIGQQVRVVYDKRNPAISSMGYPEQHLKSANVLTLMASILFSTFIMAVLWWKGPLRSLVRYLSQQARQPAE